MKIISETAGMETNEQGNALRVVQSLESMLQSRAYGARERSELVIEEVEPWPEPVDGSKLLDELREVMNRYVVLEDGAAETLALWTLHTYAFELRDITTYLGVSSPEKRCGKTTLLEVLSELVNRPVVAANISPPALFRVIEEARPTLLIDEADTFLQGNDELRGILNAGYSKKTAYVVRVASAQGVIVQGPKSNVQSLEETLTPTLSRKARENNRAYPADASRLVRFSCWCPKVMAAIGNLPETLGDRCIPIPMKRKMFTEVRERTRKLNGETLRRKCARFVRDHAEEIAQATPQVPESLNDRAATIWEPLLVLAELASQVQCPKSNVQSLETDIQSSMANVESLGDTNGQEEPSSQPSPVERAKENNGAYPAVSDWGKAAREAAEKLSARTAESNVMGSLLLDILAALSELPGDKVFTRDLVWKLNCKKERPWMDIRKGKETTEQWLSQQLKPYGIRPKTIWVNGESAKGYVKAEFGDMFARYVPRAEAEEYVLALAHKFERAKAAAEAAVAAAQAAAAQAAAENKTEGTEAQTKVSVATDESK